MDEEVAPEALGAANDDRALTRRDIAIRSPLFLDSWLEYNRRNAGVQPLRIQTSVRGSPGLDAVLYLDSGGRVVLPALNPYLPVAYEPPPHNQPVRERRHWLNAAASMVEEMRRRGLADNVILSPDVVDVRPWIWGGFRSTMSYTTIVRLPAVASRIDRELARKGRRARDAGFRWIRGAPGADIVECMVGTERRKGFKHDFSADDVTLMTSVLGHDAARTYMVYAPDGSPASSLIVLHNPGGVAVSTVGGTEPRFFGDGVTQFMLLSILHDLTNAGAIAWDMAGADIQGVALWKEGLGGELTVVPRIEPRSLKNVLRSGRDWALATRRSAGPGRSQASGD